MKAFNFIIIDKGSGEEEIMERVKRVGPLPTIHEAAGEKGRGEGRGENGRGEEGRGGGIEVTMDKRL